MEGFFFGGGWSNSEFCPPEEKKPQQKEAEISAVNYCAPLISAAALRRRYG